MPDRQVDWGDHADAMLVGPQLEKQVVELQAQAARLAAENAAALQALARIDDALLHGPDSLWAVICYDNEIQAALAAARGSCQRAGNNRYPKADVLEDECGEEAALRDAMNR